MEGFSKYCEPGLRRDIGYDPAKQKRENILKGKKLYVEDWKW